ncbi:MAG: ribosome-binding factor A [Myxococcales bacterium]|nr:ribosome-binding factor A [Myxococcales bacterium]
MSRDRSRGRRDLGPVTDADSFFGGGEEAAGRSARKERMLCRQVQEAVSDALAALDDDVLLDLWVVAVRAAPMGGPLVVVVSGARHAHPDEVLARLGRVAGYLRAEVASAITRKRVPMLAFELAPGDEVPA